MNALEFLDHWFGEPLEDVDPARISMPREQGIELLARLRSRTSLNSSAPPTHELWPILTPRDRFIPRGVRAGALSTSVNWIGALVYAHGVVLPDPLDEFVHSVGVLPSAMWIEQGSADRVEGVVRQVRVIAPLVRIGAIRFYSLRDVYRHSIELPPRIEERDAFGVTSMAFDYGDVERIRNLTLTFRLAEEGLGQPLLSQLQSQIVGAALNDDRYFDANVSDRVNTVVSAVLPRLRGVTIEDMVSMRRDGEVFAEWRGALSRALTQAMAIGRAAAGGPALADALRSALLDEVEPERRRLYDEVTRSRTLASSLVEPAALGVLSAGAGLAVGTPPAEAIAPAALASVGGTLASYVRRRRRERKNAAVLGFYTLVGAGRGE